MSAKKLFTGTAASFNGNGKATNRIGAKYFNESFIDSHEKAFAYFYVAANQQEPLAIENLARCFENGWCVAISSEKAFMYYKKAAEWEVVVGFCNPSTEGTENNHTMEQNLRAYWKNPLNRLVLYDLARCYEKGFGVEQSIKQAIHYYDLANGYSDSYSSNLLRIQSILSAEEQGNVTAFDDLGDCYKYGIGTSKSPEKAFYYYKMAAERDMRNGCCGPSIFALAKCYEQGFGTEKSSEKAFYYYKIASEWEISKGDAHYALGRCYEFGIGVQESLEMAIKCYLQAKDMKYVDNRILAIGHYYENGSGVKQSPEKAFLCYNLIAAYTPESSDAQYDLGRCFEYGIGVEKSIETAVEYYQKAAKLGCMSWHIYTIGTYYENGIDVEKSLEKAFYYYKMASECQDPRGCAHYHLARCFEFGIGIEQSLKTALKYYQIAAARGSFDSHAAIERVTELLNNANQETADTPNAPADKSLDAHAAKEGKAKKLQEANRYDSGGKLQISISNITKAVKSKKNTKTPKPT